MSPPGKRAAPAVWVWGFAPVVILFGLVAPEGAPNAYTRSLAAIEQDVVRAIAANGFDVRPAAATHSRPVASDALDGDGDVVTRYGAHRVLTLDLAPSGDVVWVSHYLKGVSGAWDVRQVRCRVTSEPDEAVATSTDAKNARLICPGLVNGILAGLRPRTHLDLDLGAALRSQARAVTRCVRREDRQPVAQRIFGRVELDVSILPEGRAKVRAVAPAYVARSPLGACLRGIFDKIEVGPFEGPPIELRLPIDL